MDWVGLLLKPFIWIYEQRTVILSVLLALRRRPLKLLICILLFVASVSLTLVYRERSNRYESVIDRAFQADPAQEHVAALESLLLSSIGDRAVEALKQEELDSAFESTWREIISSSLVYSTSFSGGTAQTQAFLVASPAATGSFSGPVLTEDSDSKQTLQAPGYLFFPSFLLGSAVSPKEYDQIRSGANLSISSSLPVTRPASARQGSPLPPTDRRAIRVVSPELLKQVLVSQSLASPLQRLSGLALVSDKSNAGKLLNATPVQAYLVTSGGLLRAFVHDDPHPFPFYGNQFPPHTFFPSRPYFWPTLDTTPSYFTRLAGHDDFIHETSRPIAGVRFGDFFHVSTPYLDLGGGGLVITLTRGLIIDGITTAVICIDLRFDEDISVVIRKMMRELGGSAFLLACDVTYGSQHLICQETDGDPKEEELYNRVHNSFPGTSVDVLSSLYRFDEGSKIRFSMPLYREIQQNGSQKLSLVIAEVDLKSYKQRTDLIATSAVTCFVALIILLAWLWSAGEVSRSEYTKAFDAVDRVMENCPTPYIRLNSQDFITYANAAFLKLLGFSARRDAQQKKLAELCVGQDSIDQYQRVEEARRSGLQVTDKTGAPASSYDLRLAGPNGQEQVVTVFGAAIPNATLGDLPETFGILVHVEKTPDSTGRE